MSVQTDIQHDLISALKSHDSKQLSVLRLLTNDIKNESIKLGKELSNDEVFTIVNRETKKRHETAKLYSDNGRSDSAEQELYEISILSRYLPEQMNDDELSTVIDEIIKSQNNLTMKDFGRLMGEISHKTKGTASGQRISEILRKKINSNE